MKAVGISSRKSDKPRKVPRQSPPGFCWEREEILFDNSFNLTLSPLSLNPNRFCFFPFKDEESELVAKVFKGISPNLLNGHLQSLTLKTIVSFWSILFHRVFLKVVAWNLVVFETRKKNQEENMSENWKICKQWILTFVCNFELPIL